MENNPSLRIKESPLVRVIPLFTTIGFSYYSVIIMSKSNENLAAAFAGESQANRKYLAFAKKAKDEGYPQIGMLFKAAAAAETVHAHNHLRIMGGINDTKANIQEAIAGETHEYTKMYPEFLDIAAEEGANQASWSFNIANEVEKIHAGLYTKAAEALAADSDLKAVDYYVCDVCGNTVEGAPLEKCPICNAGAKAFTKVE
jgi:rubrerythrin